MSTRDNLKAAFDGEARAFIRYTAYANAAARDGFKQTARLFRALAEAEKVHALSHLAALGEVADSESNIMSAIDGETYEFTQMYPKFLTQAEREGDHRAAISFKGAMAAEKVHSNLLKKALDKLGKSKEFEFYVCSICGHVSLGDAPDKCPGCGAANEKFTKVE